MKYREKIHELIFDDNPNALIEWIATQPLLEQVEILKEFKQMAMQNMFRSNNLSIMKSLKKFTKQIDAYEKAVLEEIKAEREYKKALEDQERSMKELEEATLGVKKYVIDCIVNNEPNANEMRGFAEKIIAMEKDSGTYDPLFWKAIE